MNRTDVYKIIDTERDYQNMTNPLEKLTVSEELLMMEHYLTEARTKWVTTEGDQASLDFMRKVVGIGVRCFENHGCPSRQIYHIPQYNKVIDISKILPPLESDN